MNQARPLLFVWSVSVAVTLSSARVSAAEFGYVLGAGIEYSDNIELAKPGDEESDLAYVLNGGLTYRDQAANLDTRMALTGQYRVHRDDTFDDEFFGVATLGLVWKPYPSLFHWAVDNIYTPTIDPQEKLTPANIRHVNVFSTGPDIFIRLGPVDTVNLGGRASDARFQDEDGDYTAAQGYLRWLHRVSALTTVSLNHDRYSVRYKDADDADDDFGQITNYAGLNYESPVNRFDISAGYSTIDRAGEDLIRTRIGSLVWDRTISGRTAFNLRLVQSLDDAARDAVRQVADQPQPDPGAIPTASTTDVFLLREAVATLRWGISPGGGRASSISAFWRDKEYELDVQNDEQDQGVAVGIVWPFSTLLLGQLSASYTEKDFYGLTPPRLDEEKIVQLSLGYLLDRRTTLTGWIRRSSNESNVRSEDYRENRFGVNISYAVSSGQRR